MDTVAADKMHRGHAIIEQVTADLKGCAPIHPPPNPRPDPTSR
jgi:hypothetical protein